MVTPLWGCRRLGRRIRASHGRRPRASRRDATPPPNIRSGRDKSPMSDIVHLSLGSRYTRKCPLAGALSDLLLIVADHLLSVGLGGIILFPASWRECAVQRHGGVPAYRPRWDLSGSGGRILPACPISHGMAIPSRIVLFEMDWRLLGRLGGAGGEKHNAPHRPDEQFVDHVRFFLSGLVWDDGAICPDHPYL